MDYSKTGLRKSLIIIAAVIGVVFMIGVIVLLAVLLSGGEETVPTPETTPATSSPAETPETGDSSRADPGETTATNPSAPAITNMEALITVCRDGTYPDGVVASESGTKAAIMLLDYRGAWEFSAAAYSGTDIRPTFNSNQADFVVCLTPSDRQAFSVDCDADGTKFKLVGFEIDADVYKISSQQKVGQIVLQHSKQCPLFAVLVGGQAEAVGLDINDEKRLEDYIKGLAG